MHQESILCIIICSYNREEVLIDCLTALQLQNHPSDSWKILVVNNYHKPISENSIAFINATTNAELIHELDPGLSRARNIGVHSSRSEWIAFLDDDAKVPKDYVSRIMTVIDTEHFDCFGGGIQSWWRYGKPKWLDEAYGSKPPLLDSIGIINEGYNWGSNIILRRSALEAVGRFPEYIGMKGYHIGYAAENIVQDKLRERGYRIGYVPDLIIEHVVAVHKLKLSWHLRAAYATGRDGRNVFVDQYGFIGMLKSLKSCFSRPLKGVFHFLVKKEYPWQQLYLEFTIPWMLLFGKLKSIIPQV